MDKLLISSVVGDLVEQYFLAATSGNRDCRLLVPGLTPTIAHQIHNNLIEKGVESYLVIGPEKIPSEEQRCIRAVGLTSKRIGSFVAVATPGQLVHIQDSIRGSGGTIRSLAFSEEWPWIDNGSEPFKFDGPVINRLLDTWSLAGDERRWIRDYILKGLIVNTRTSTRRTKILLEEILGSFSPDLYPGIDSTVNKFLYHTGVPCPSSHEPDIPRFIQNMIRLCKRVIDRCQKEDDIREQARAMVHEVISEGEREETTKSLDQFLDGLGAGSTTELQLLTFYGCWGGDKKNTTHWCRLPADTLEQLFSVRLRERAQISYRVNCPRGITAPSRDKVATFIGESLGLEVDFNIPEDQFSVGEWSLRILNRQSVLHEQFLGNSQGSISVDIDTASSLPRYSKKISLRIAIVNNSEIESDARLSVHLCGNDRPAFVLVDPSFEVIDATLTTEDEAPDKKLAINEPVHIYLFSWEDEDCSISDENEIEFDLVETVVSGVLRTALKSDASNDPSGILVRLCQIGDLTAVLSFEASDLERGEFTLEDEFRVAISGVRERHLKELIRLFKGKSNEPFPYLGKIDEGARVRNHLASIADTQQGWRPLLADLLNVSDLSSGPIGEFVNCLGLVNADAFNNITFNPDALCLLSAYSEARYSLITEVSSSFETNSQDHPIYASHPIYINDRDNRIESLIKEYLIKYLEIIEYLRNNQKTLEWSHLFVLSHLDCIVHWDNTRLRNALFFLGPWHPLTVAKRFMVQAALFARANRLENESSGKIFRHLAFLLGNIQGFRWVLGMSAEDRSIEHAYVCVTSDPGWHFAIKLSLPDLATREGGGNLSDVVAKIRKNFGLVVSVGKNTDNTLATTCLYNYLRAFPSRRSIGIRIRNGYNSSDIVTSIHDHIHNDEGPTSLGNLIPGGVRLYFESSLNDGLEVRWTDPPLAVYTYPDDEDCISSTHPDLYMLPSADELSFRSYNEAHSLPRGEGKESVFYKQLNRLTEGHTSVPKSIFYEFDVLKSDRPDDIGGVFIGTVGSIGEILGEPKVTVSDLLLPERLNAPWVIIPGSSIDPAILVQYVKIGSERDIQDRALWDYRYDISGKDNSYFVLSTIPKGFQVAVNGFFGRDDIATSFIAELGRIGIAIGGEALKSGRHALGVIGLIGAVRLMTGELESGESPLSADDAVGFLVPVDSFSSFFGSSGLGEGKRTDLLAIFLNIPTSESNTLTISACGIEAKFVSSTYNSQQASNALEQAKETTAEFTSLVQASLKMGAMPERLALIDIISFGLRISSPGTPSEIEKWVETERIVLNSILSGDYRYLDAKHQGVLVSTEGGLQGTADAEQQDNNLWIRVNKSHWPGISESPGIVRIRERLNELFKSRPYNITTQISLNAKSKQLSLLDSTTINKTESAPQPTEIEVTNADESFSANGELSEESETENESNMGATAETEQTLLTRIYIGADDTRGKINYDPQSLVDPLQNLNMMVTGSSGTGKTQFLKYLICQIRRQAKPVLIVDLKNDFASDPVFCSLADLERVFVSFDGLPLNPLIPYPVKHPATGELFIQCSQHIAGVSSVLKRTYGLGPQQQAAVKRAIEEAFQANGIQTSGSSTYSNLLPFPDFSVIGEILEESNLAAYNRLDPLFTLNLFRPEYRTQSFKDLVDKAVVLDFSQIPSDEIKNTLAQLLALSAHAYYNAQPHSGTIRQFLIFDEAHRVLNSDYMVRLVRECRAYGVGTVLSSQYPSDFPSDISSSIATKVIHGNGRDIDRVRSIVQLLGCEESDGQVANLERFQCFVDNQHHAHALTRTMTFPLFLVYRKLQEVGEASYDELSSTDGIDINKLPMENIVYQLERMGLAEVRDNKVFLLSH
ncbi:ATP-binding protein [Thermodesulfobacteriota bacterium]